MSIPVIVLVVMFPNSRWHNPVEQCNNIILNRLVLVFLDHYCGCGTPCIYRGNPCPDPAFPDNFMHRGCNVVQPVFTFSADFNDLLHFGLFIINDLSLHLIPQVTSFQNYGFTLLPATHKKE